MLHVHCFSDDGDTRGVVYFSDGSIAAFTEKRRAFRSPSGVIMPAPPRFAKILSEALYTVAPSTPWTRHQEALIEALLPTS